VSGDIFLDIEGIEGESKKKDFEKKIEVDSFSWGESNPTSFAFGAGGGVGKVQMQDVSFTKPIDKASPKLYQACANGDHINKATFTFRKAGKEAQKYLTVELTEIMISSIALSDSSNSELPHESVSIAYGKIVFGYKPQKDDGTLDANMPFGWNIKEHKAEQT